MCKLSQHKNGHKTLGNESASKRDYRVARHFFEFQMLNVCSSNLTQRYSVVELLLSKKARARSHSNDHPIKTYLHHPLVGSFTVLLDRTYPLPPNFGGDKQYHNSGNDHCSSPPSCGNPTPLVSTSSLFAWSADCSMYPKNRICFHNGAP